MAELLTFNGRFLLRTPPGTGIPEEIEECDSFPCSFDIIDLCDDHSAVIASLSGPIAARMLWLFNAYMTEKIAEGKFNCFNAIHLIMGTNTKPEWEPNMKEQGEKLFVEDACRSMDVPLIFQICGQARDSSSDQWVHQVLHSAIVMGVDRHRHPIVCEKDTHRQLRIVPWSNIWPGYFPGRSPEYLRSEYVKCFPASEMSPLVYKPQT